MLLSALEFFVDVILGHFEAHRRRRAGKRARQHYTGPHSLFIYGVNLTLIFNQSALRRLILGFYSLQ